MKISGNTILITGGSRGIGFEMAKQFISKGNTVIITGRNKDALDKAKSQLDGLVAIVSDVSKEDELKSLTETLKKDFPKLNVLINNAGIMRTINLHNPNNNETLTAEIDTNIKGTILLTSALLPLLNKQEEAAVVNVTSGLAFVPLPISPVYCATKAALHSYTLSLRVQFADTKIKIFELAPPATKTEILKDFNPDDMKGIPIMSVEKMVDEFVKGFQNDSLEIRPGQANQLKFMSRFFPNFILKQMSKSAKRMLETTT